MVGLVGGALLELAAAHLLPVLVAEAGSLALRAAARGLSPAGPAGRAAQPGVSGTSGVVSTLGAPALRLVPSAIVLSHVPGRVRFRLAGLRGDAQRVDVIAGRLARVPGVLDATVCAVTGTVLVHYDAERTGLAALQAAAEPPLRPRGAHPPPSGRPGGGACGSSAPEARRGGGPSTIPWRR
jgi:Heavy metal associated domain 2